MTRKQLLERVEFWRARLAPELRVAFMDHPPPGHEAEDFLENDIGPAFGTWPGRKKGQ